jgi:adenylate kinase family enzyme
MLPFLVTIERMYRGQFPSAESELSASLFDALGQRTLVIGHSGSGKSVFAESLHKLLGGSVVELDLLHWEAEGFGVKRDEAATMLLVSAAADAPLWVIEGVYGWLAEVALSRATALVWLDLAWFLCREGLLARGHRRGASESDFAERLRWAEA